MVRSHLRGMRVSKCLAEKLKRVRSGAPFRTLDLFAGCGGISLGARLAGCEIVGAVEFDPFAASSHASNFHGHLSAQVQGVHARPRDITTTSPAELVREIAPGSTRPSELIDLLVAGPPCQAFARVGRAKLREIMEHPNAFLHDKRSGLYAHLLEYVEVLAPAGGLRTFPDNYFFRGPKRAQHLLFANALPPLLARQQFGRAALAA